MNLFEGYAPREFKVISGSCLTGKSIVQTLVESKMYLIDDEDNVVYYEPTSNNIDWLEKFQKSRIVFTIKDDVIKLVSYDHEHVPAYKAEDIPDELMKKLNWYMLKAVPYKSKMTVSDLLKTTFKG